MYRVDNIPWYGQPLFRVFGWTLGIGLYFSLASSSGNWRVPEMQGWQSAAGLQSAGTASAMCLPGWKMVLGKKG